jgi:hypothetical protein
MPLGQEPLLYLFLITVHKVQTLNQHNTENKEHKKIAQSKPIKAKVLKTVPWRGLDENLHPFL